VCVCVYACTENFSSSTTIGLRFFFSIEENIILFLVFRLQTLNLFLIVETTIRVSIFASLSKCRRVVMSKIGQYVPILDGNREKNRTVPLNMFHSAVCKIIVTNVDSLIMICISNTVLVDTNCNNINESIKFVWAP